MSYFFCPPLFSLCVVPFFKASSEQSRGNNARSSSKGGVGRGILAIPDWINFKNILSVSFRVLYRSPLSLYKRRAKARKTRAIILTHAFVVARRRSHQRHLRRGSTPHTDSYPFVLPSAQKSVKVVFVGFVWTLLVYSLEKAWELS